MVSSVDDVAGPDHGISFLVYPLSWEFRLPQYSHVHVSDIKVIGETLCQIRINIIMSPFWNVKGLLCFVKYCTFIKYFGGNCGSCFVCYV